MAARKGQGLYRRNTRSQRAEAVRQYTEGDRSAFRSPFKRVKEVPVLLKTSPLPKVVD